MSERALCRQASYWLNETIKSPRSVGYKDHLGYYTDRETGLHLLPLRYNDAGVDRFLTRDPVGYACGINLYGTATATATW